MPFRTNKTPVLQEKTASGSVATFNTALAMPLVNGEFTIQAYQEGSGDPSPVNVRNIIPFNTQKITKTGKNLFDKTKITPNKWLNVDTGEIENAISSYCISDFIFVKGGTSYTMSNSYSRRKWFYDLNKQPIAEMPINSYTFVPPSDCYIVITIGLSSSTGILDTFQVEVGSTGTPYEPYVTPTIYTIQLGQEVYGAEVDVVNGVAHCTWTAVDMGNMEWTRDSYNRFASGTIKNLIKHSGTGWSKDFWCEILTPTTTSLSQGNYLISMYKPTGVIYANDSDYTIASDFKNAVTGKKLMFELAEPFDIQLTPTQIETLIGNNTIFADTGNIDLTYKDLDIAKRGNFREVFRLPS